MNENTDLHTNIVKKLPVIKNENDLWKDPEFGPSEEDPTGGKSMYIDPTMITENLDDLSDETAKRNAKKGILPGMPKPDDVEWLTPK